MHTFAYRTYEEARLPVDQRRFSMLDFPTLFGLDALDRRYFSLRNNTSCGRTTGSNKEIPRNSTAIVATLNFFSPSRLTWL
jgi:hypothetical protein